MEVNDKRITPLDNILVSGDIVEARHQSTVTEACVGEVQQEASAAIEALGRKTQSDRAKNEKGAGPLNWGGRTGTTVTVGAPADTVGQVPQSAAESRLLATLGISDYASVERTLAKGAIENVEPLKAESSNEVLLVTFVDGSKGVFKPHDGERALTVEVASYEMSRRLDMHLVPPTVVRKVGGRWGSLQLFVDLPNGEHAKTEPSMFDIRRLKIFDYVMGNEDRHDGNYLIASDGSVIAIDNDNAFQDCHRQNKLDLTERSILKMEGYEEAWRGLRKCDVEELIPIAQRGACFPEAMTAFVSRLLLVKSALGHGWSV